MRDPEISTDAGIVVRVSVDAGSIQRRASSGLNEIARHRPTRFALMMRRNRANVVRKGRGQQQLPAIMPGPCEPCAGLGVVGEDRRRCPLCNGSGQ